MQDLNRYLGNDYGDATLSKSFLAVTDITMQNFKSKVQFNMSKVMIIAIHTFIKMDVKRTDQT